MAEESKFDLPSSSYKELVKIIQGYGHGKDNISLDEIANLVGMNKSGVSGNNGFLKSVGLIKGGNKKTPTDLCRTLGKAYEHDQKDEIRRTLGELIAGITRPEEVR